MAHNTVDIDTCTKFLKCLSDGALSRQELLECVGCGSHLGDRLIKTGLDMGILERDGSRGFGYIKAVTPKELAEGTRGVMPYPSSRKKLKQPSTKKPTAVVKGKGGGVVSRVQHEETPTELPHTIKLKLLIMECEVEQVGKLLSYL